MNKFFIQVNENKEGLYDFIIELINENHMTEKAVIGTRENIDSLNECINMIKDFPLSPSSVLVEVSFNRRNKYLKLNKLEQLFVENLKRKYKVREYMVNLRLKVADYPKNIGPEESYVLGEFVRYEDADLVKENTPKITRK